MANPAMMKAIIEKYDTPKVDTNKLGKEGKRMRKHELDDLDVCEELYYHIENINDQIHRRHQAIIDAHLDAGEKLYLLSADCHEFCKQYDIYDDAKVVEILGIIDRAIAEATEKGKWDVAQSMMENAIGEIRSITYKIWDSE